MTEKRSGLFPTLLIFYRIAITIKAVGSQQPFYGSTPIRHTDECRYHKGTVSMCLLLSPDKPSISMQIHVATGQIAAPFIHCFIIAESTLHLLMAVNRAALWSCHSSVIWVQPCNQRCLPPGLPPQGNMVHTCIQEMPYKQTRKAASWL